MKILKHSILIPLLWLFSFCASMSAEPAKDHPFLHPLFADHAVLQREVKVPVWGWSAPGTTVTVTFSDQRKMATTGPDGKWLVRLDAMSASATPQILTVATTDRTNTVTDVLVGDVWLASGQSNMEMGVGNCNVPDEIAAANHLNIRLLTVPRKVATEPQSACDCQWLPCNPTTIMVGQWSGFSAAAPINASEVQKMTHSRPLLKGIRP